MQLAADAIMGERDFSAFCRKPEPQDDDIRSFSGADNADDCAGDEDDVAAGNAVSDTRTAPVSMKRFVMQANWKRNGDMVTFEVRANAFCHQMVRSLVGTFVDIGLGKRPPSDMMALIRSGRRADASQIAPPHGLCLWEVGYPAQSE
jgi:tRNA U38,U39,U40 pseudouridine synthase TruA